MDIVHHRSLSLSSLCVTLPILAIRGGGGANSLTVKNMVFFTDTCFVRFFTVHCLTLADFLPLPYLGGFLKKNLTLVDFFPYLTLADFSHRLPFADFLHSHIY
jgi:hypothetical protein